MAEIVETQISNAEIKRVVMKLLREGQYNQTDIELLFRRLYTEIQSRYPERTTYVYNYVSRKFSAQMASEMKAQRKDDVLLLNNLYKQERVMSFITVTDSEMMEVTYGSVV